MMATGQCSCDEEHMFSCPKDTNTINADKGHEGRDDLDNVLDSLLAGKVRHLNIGLLSKKQILNNKNKKTWKNWCKEATIRNLGGGVV